MCTSPIWIPPSRFLIYFITYSKNKLKRLGDRRHPCLTPVPTLNQLVMLIIIIIMYDSYIAHISSVASFWVLGGKAPKCTDRKENNHVHVTCASASQRYVFMCQNTCYIYMHILLIMHFPYITYSMALYNNNIPTKHYH